VNNCNGYVPSVTNCPGIVPDVSPPIRTELENGVMSGLATILPELGRVPHSRSMSALACWHHSRITSGLPVTRELLAALP
jgi:hypothetical protein